MKAPASGPLRLHPIALSNGMDCWGLDSLQSHHTASQHLFLSNGLIHLFIDSFTHSFIQAFIHSFAHSLIHSWCILTQTGP